MFPPWYCHKGYKMRIVHFDPGQGKLTLAGGATLRIRPYAEREWLVSWNVVIFHQTEWTQGQRVFGSLQLECAFGLIDRLPSSDPDDEDRAMAERYDADVAYPGLYVRKGRYLNIPEPGSGFFPHGSVSVELRADMQDAIRKLTAR